MVEFIENATSGRSHCKQCKHKIYKGEPRGVKYGNYAGRPSRFYLCSVCAQIEVLTQIQQLGIQVVESSPDRTQSPDLTPIPYPFKEIPPPARIGRPQRLSGEEIEGNTL